MADAAAIMIGIGAGMDGMLYPIHERAGKILNLAGDDVPEIMAETAEYLEKTVQEF